MPTSKFSKVMQAVGEVAYSRSPILGQAMEVADVFKRPDHANDPHATRMGNIKNFVVDSAIQRSPVLNKMAQAFDFIKSLKDDQNSPPIPVPDPNLPPAPAPTPVQNPVVPTQLPDFSVNPGDPVATAQSMQEVLENSPSKVVEFFDDEKNMYYKSMEASRTHLEKIVEMLKEQSELMKKTFKIQEEVNERMKGAADLSTVGRGDMLPNSLKLPPDMAQFEGPDENQTGKEGEPGWMEWLKDNAAGLILGGGWGLSKIKSLWRGTKGAVGKVISKAPKLSNIIPSIKGAGGAVTKAELLGASEIGAKATSSVGSKAASWLTKGAGFALRSLTSLPAQAAMLALDPTEAGRDNQEIFRQEIFNLLEKSGVSALPKVREMLNSDQGKYVRETFPSPEYEILAKDDEAAWKYARDIFNSSGKPNKLGATGIIYSDTNATISRMMQDYTKDGDGFTLSPDAVRQKIMNSQAAINNQSSLDIINKSNTQAAPPTTNQQPPLVVGGPTNISNNNGGNVTNVYNSGRDSLMMPQLAFNLPSTVY